MRYVFRDLPLDFHKNAFKAAEATHCAGEQGKFWEMHALLFQNQAALGPEQLPAHAKTLGLGEAKFQECLASGRFAADIRKDMADAGAVGISGTPSFLVGVVQPDGRVRVMKKLVGARPYAEFKAAFDSLLAAAGARRDRGADRRPRSRRRAERARRIAVLRAPVQRSYGEVILTSSTAASTRLAVAASAAWNRMRTVWPANWLMLTVWVT